MEDLLSLTVCLWQTASFAREDIARVRSEFELHVGAAVQVESCQRLEAYSLGDCACHAPVRLSGKDALLHMAAVASGLQSVVLGEEQVMGQVRAALEPAAGPLRGLGDIAVAAARELRRNNNLTAHSGHLLDRGLAVGGVEAGGSILIVGTGHTARLVARRAQERGFASITIAGRRKPDASWFDGRAFRFLLLDDLPNAVPVDVAVGCLGSEAPAIDVAAGIPPVRRLILDLGTPRNFSGHSAAPLLTIATLLEAGQRHGTERREKLQESLRAILERRLEMAGQTRHSAVGALRAAVERVRTLEIERIQRLHPEIPRETMDTITRSFVNQLFRLPTERLKALDDPELGDQFVALFSEDAVPEAASVKRYA
ncbi:MAG: hypothetical protein HY875_16660 [Chloroflexi bacterium]|nr:hypothetical protein [Chloroflexota bacterium]